MKPYLAAIAFAIAFIGGASADDKKIDPAKLLGKWEVTKSESEPELKGSFAEFSKDNKVSVTVSVKGKTRTFTGTYKVNGDQLSVTLKDPDDGKESSDTDTIESLTADKFVLVDTKKKKTEFAKKK